MYVYSGFAVGSSDCHIKYIYTSVFWLLTKYVNIIKLYTTVIKWGIFSYTIRSTQHIYPNMFVPRRLLVSAKKQNRVIVLVCSSTKYIIKTFICIYF